MPGEGDLIAIRMKLLGGKEAAAEADAVSASIAETGVASEEASAKSVEASKASETAVKKEAIARQNATRVAKKQAATTTAIGKGLTKWVTGSVLAIGAASVYMNSKVERNLLTLHTQAGVAKKELKGLRAEFQAISKETGFSTENIIGAGYRLAGAGLRGKKLKEATRSSALLAMVGNADPEDTAKTLSQIWFTNIKGGKDFDKVIGEINATVGAGDLRLPQLVDALGTGVVASAKQAGLTLQDVNGAMAVFGDETNNVSGWSAQLATALHFLYAPTEKAEGALHSLGLSGTKLGEAMHGPKGLATALGMLKKPLEELPGGADGTKAAQVLSSILPGGRGRVLLVLLNQLERLEQKEKQIRNTREEFGQSVKETQEQPLIKLKKAWQQVENAMLELGAALTPVVIPFLEKLGSFAGAAAGWFDGLSDSTKGLLGEVVGLAAALGPLILMGDKLAKIYEGVRAFSAVSSVAGAESAVGPTLGARFGLAGAGVGASLIAGQAVGGTAGNLISGVGSGAAVGAAFGSVVPGLGTLAGAGIGAAAGGALAILPGLLSGGGKKLSPLRKELQHLSAATKTYKSAVDGLVGSEKAVATTAQRHHKAVKNEAAAEKRLAQVLSHTGNESAATYRAQRRLDAAQRAVTKSARAEQHAHQLSGIRARVFRQETLHLVASIKQTIPVMKARVATLRQEANEQPHNTAKQIEAAQAIEHLGHMNQRLNKTYAEAAEKGGERFAKSLQHLSSEQAKFGNNGRVLKTRLLEVKGKMQEVASEGGKTSGVFSQMKEEVRELNAELARFTENIEGVNPARLKPGTQGTHGHGGEAPHAPERGNHRVAPHGNGHGPGTQSRHTGPVDRWSNSPDSHPTEYTAPTSSSRGGRGTKTLQPIVLQVGRRQLANITAEIEQDDEARL